MNSSSLKPLVIIALSALSFSAFASTYAGSCTSEPKSNWMTVKDMQTTYEKQGYSVRRIKSEGTCYEIYTMDKDGKKVELFVNPANGTVVHEARKS